MSFAFPPDSGYNGYRVKPQPGQPWLGQITELPAIDLPPAAFTEALNFLFLRGRVQTRPRLNAYSVTPDGKTAYAFRSYKDVNGNAHTLVLTSKNMYAITTGPLTLNALSFPAGVTDLGSVERPFGILGLHNRVYFSNGAVKLLYTDGSNALKIAGDVPGGARFLAIAGAHLLMAYLREDGIDSPTTVRWSTLGDPNSYAQASSGANQLIEVPDEITGLVPVGRSVFIARTNGVTVVTPTGIGVAPLAFENFSTEPEGVGNKYPYTLAAYGNRYVIFVSDDNIYEMTLPTVVPIGGANKREIFKDIANATGTITGRIVPNLGVNFDFLSYWLTIPKSGTSTTWILNLENRAWSKFESATGALSALATVFTT